MTKSPTIREILEGIKHYWLIPYSYKDAVVEKVITPKEAQQALYKAVLEVIGDDERVESLPWSATQRILKDAVSVMKQHRNDLRRHQRTALKTLFGGEE